MGGQLQLFSIVIFLFFACEKPLPTKEEFAQNIEEQYSAHSSMSYMADFQMKFYSSTDTVRKLAKVHLLPLAEDTNFKGMIWIEQDTTIRFYDGKQSYLIYPNQEKIIKFPEGANFIFTGNVIGDVVDIYFLKPERIHKGVADTSINSSFSQVKFEEENCYLLEYDFPDTESYHGAWKKVWFRTDDYSLRRMQTYFESEGEVQYQEWNISQVSYDQVSEADLKARFDSLSDRYSLEDYEPTKRDSLDYGQAFPQIEGYRYPDSTTLDWDSLKGRWTLVDFWYMDCPPCQDAIPVLNELADRYPKLAVIGLNPYDNNEKNLGRMPKFLSYHPMNYPSYFIERKMPQKAKVFAYPTLFLLNPELEVEMIKLGYGENTEFYLDSLIQAKL